MKYVKKAEGIFVWSDLGVQVSSCVIAGAAQVQSDTWYFIVEWQPVRSEGQRREVWNDIMLSVCLRSV